MNIEILKNIVPEQYMSRYADMYSDAHMQYVIFKIWDSQEILNSNRYPYIQNDWTDENIATYIADNYDNLTHKEYADLLIVQVALEW